MNKIAQSLRIPSSDGPSITECHEAANEIERLENLLATLAFYRDAYEKHLARGEALEKDNTRLYEQEALHTESYGIVCAERDRAVKALSEEQTRLQYANEALIHFESYPARGEIDGQGLILLRRALNGWSRK